MAYIDFLSVNHKATSRDYLGRVLERPKAEAAAIARRFDRDYWDGDRSTGYGGYRNDGRWARVASLMAEHYGLKAGDRVLDVGCGKAFLLGELARAVPGLVAWGIDVSEYALQEARADTSCRYALASAARLPFADASFDLVFSINTIHNLYCFDAHAALRELQRVGRGRRYLCVESYRSEQEKANLLYWQLTCEMFCTPDEWAWWFAQTGYTGDHSFIYFEGSERGAP